MFWHPMPDHLTREQRSALMSRIRGRDTQPELAVRRLLRSSGIGYRLHCRDLPGSPDIVMRGRGAVIFVHGCFWHQHARCRKAARPTSRVAYWNLRLDRNLQRDATALRELRALGWRALVLWECELRDQQLAARKIARFLDQGSTHQPQGARTIRRTIR